MGSRCTLLRPGPTPYDDALQLQRRLSESVRDGGPPALVLLEHPPTYTLGARGLTESVVAGEAALAARGAAVVHTDRGGDVTFHGPGQLVAFPILDLRRFGQGPVAYIRNLEAVLIDALASFGIVAGRSAGRPGVWVGAEKIAAIGVRISRGVTTHGFALNVNTDLAYFDHIVPCGLPGVVVTSMQRLTGETLRMRDVEDAVAAAFAAQFGVDLDEDETPHRVPAAAEAR